MTIAMHILGFLACEGRPLTSAAMARVYGTSPVVLRRVLAKLQRAGLVVTKRGVGGGSELALPPAEINLRQAYEAVADDTALLPRHPGDATGAVAPILAGFVDDLYEDAEQALLKKLESVTVAEMDRTVRSRIRRRRHCP